MMKRIQVIFINYAITMLLLLTTQETMAMFSWDWDSGTTEGWEARGYDTIVSIEQGRNGTFGLGARRPILGNPLISVSPQYFDTAALVGGQTGFGSNLEMTAEIYVDVNRKMNNAPGEYIDLWVLGSTGEGRYICNPFREMGWIEDLGDGWFRHYFENEHHQDTHLPDPSPLIYLYWKWSKNAASEPVVFDNFTITPEPSCLILLALGTMMIRKKNIN